MYHPRLIALALAITALHAAACSDKRGPDGRDSGGDDGADGSSGGYRCKWYERPVDNAQVPAEDEEGVATDTTIRLVLEGEPIWLDDPYCADGIWGFLEMAPEWGDVWTWVEGSERTAFADNGRVTWEFEPDEALRANTEYYVSVNFDEHLWGGGGYFWLFTTGSSSSATRQSAPATRLAPTSATPAAASQGAP